MSLFDYFKRKPTPAGDPPQGDAAVVQRARQQARRRLIGAAVLLGVGVIGFPLLFETQPRPIPVDIPIEIPAKDGAAPLRMPASRTRVAGPVVSEPVPAGANVASAPEALPAAPAPGVTTAPAIAPPAASRPVPKAEAPAAAREPALPPTPTPAPTLAATPAPAPTSTASKPASNAEPKATATASPAASAATEPRFVVQVGAFADAAAARAVRLRVEKLGLKTFTQVVETPAGKRIRVRVGPYSAKAEADKAAQTIHKGDLPAAVLVL